MNQAAGLELLVGTHERSTESANLEDIATGDIIVVEEIALQNLDSTSFIKDKSQIGRHVLRIQICF